MIQIEEFWTINLKIPNIYVKFDLSEKSGRSKFSTKVLITVFIQFGVLVAFCNGFMYGELADYIDPTKNSSSYWTLIVSSILVPIILIVFFMKPNLMTQAPKCYISLVFLTCVIGSVTFTWIYLLIVIYYWN